MGRGEEGRPGGRRAYPHGEEAQATKLNED